MKNPFKFLLPLIALLFALPAAAFIDVSGYGTARLTGSSTMDDYYDNYCSAGNIVTDTTGAAFVTTNCANRTSLQILPATGASIVQDATHRLVSDSEKTSWNNKQAPLSGSGFVTASGATISYDSTTYLPLPSGTTAQYIRGDGSLATLPTGGTRTFQYPGVTSGVSARALNGCFQVSATQDADVNYSVNANILLSLGGGNAALTSYTNSGCTTGAQALFNGAVSNVALGGVASIPLHAIAKGGTWLKITGAVTGGVGSTVSVDSVQAETLLP